uniref:Uncharacterized protein n=1 Tax=Kalanchoe fedtschenkoi TaxID=63787 RepID=A0A7N0VJR3_KALFE
MIRYCSTGYCSTSALPSSREVKNLPMWRADGAILTLLLHAGPVEFLYYWFHRALHHHFLYSRYHSHHHSSIATEPITSVSHPFAEHIVYYALFAIPMVTAGVTGVASVGCVAGYIFYLDLMNNMGHCNFEFIPKWVFSVFPPLKYIMYTPSFHSLHHTRLRTNYSLFMPFYDYIYGTVDVSTDDLHTAALKREEDEPQVVHLTHLTTPESIYHTRLGFAAFASRPYATKWFMWLMWPVTVWSVMWNRIYGRTVVTERNRFEDLTLQTWIIPKYKFQSPNLKIRLVDGSSLAVAIVLHKIPEGTSQVLLSGQASKVALHVSVSLCEKGIKVVTTNDNAYNQLKRSVAMSNNARARQNLILSKTYDLQTWLVGDELSEAEHRKAPKGAHLIPVSQIPPKKLRPDCIYHSTPAMIAPPSLQNVDSCENWLPRGVLSASRVAGIVHALENTQEHEFGSRILNPDAIWQAAIKHGFQPLNLKNP